MLTLISSNESNTNKKLAEPNQASNNTEKGEELLLSYLLWADKFESDAHETFDDPVDVFLCSQKERSLELV